MPSAEPLKSTIHHALRGETRFEVACLGFMHHQGKTVNAVRLSQSFVFATSLADAIRRISEIKPDHPIVSIHPADQSVCIKFLVAYPCRLARWIFNYAAMREHETKATRSTLLIQSRKVSVKHINGRPILHLAIPANAPVFDGIPDDGATATVGFWDVGNRDDVHATN